MGANIKIKKLSEQLITNEHARFVRSLLKGAEADTNSIHHVEHISYFAGGSCPIHVHEDSEEIFFILRGTGVAFLDDDEIPFGPGTVLWIPKGVKHGLKCDEDGMVEHLVCCVSPV